jgi:HEAT repeat protein
MGYYDLPKPEREAMVAAIHATLSSGFQGNALHEIEALYADQDTYVRKAAYLETGKVYLEIHALRPVILDTFRAWMEHPDYKVRQTVINAAGEIGKWDFPVVERFFAIGLFDKHHSPRNAVIGSIKKMGEKNPGPVLAWCEPYLRHPDKEVRREICHGIELRGRTHPQDILPMLQQLQWDKTSRVRNTVVHVIGQIAYKRGCLETVVEHLKHWENRDLVADARAEILVIHDRYRNFSRYTVDEARAYLERNPM